MSRVRQTLWRHAIRAARAAYADLDHTWLAPLLRGARPLRAAAGALAGRAGALVRPTTTLIVPVLDAEPAVAAWLGRERVDFEGIPLHVTSMFPFLPARSVGPREEKAVAALARGIEPFTFTLARLGAFPGVHYLAAEPAAPFREITNRIQRQWPSCLPYGGALGPVVTPHMSVAYGDRLPADPAALERVLPIVTRAAELWLMDKTVRGWRIRRRFPLGAEHVRAPGDGHADVSAGPENMTGDQRGRRS